MAGIVDAMAGGASGWAAAGEGLGAAMSGGTSNSQKVYDDTMLRGHRVQRALAEAKQETLKLQAQQQLREKLEGVMPGDPAGAAALSTVMLGGYNPGEAWRGIEGARKQRATAVAADLAAAGDLDGMNRQLIIAQGKPVELTKATGNTIISPYEAMNSQDPEITPYGQGVLDDKAARTAGANAAAMVRANRPPASHGSGKPQPTARDAALDAVANDILQQAKLDDRDITGLDVKAIRYALDRHGEVRDRSGNVLGRFDWQEAGTDEPDEIPPAPAPGLPAPKAPPATSSPSAALSGAPVTAPGKSTDALPDVSKLSGSLAGVPIFDPINGGLMPKTPAAGAPASERRYAVATQPPLGSKAAQTIQQAQQALAAGAPAQQVRSRLQSMGIDPALAGL